MKKEVVSLLVVLIILPAIIFAVLVLDGTTTYSSTDTNITQETGFAHLNISDADLILYMPFDYNHTSGVVYDYSNSSRNGTMVNFTNNYTATGKYGGAYAFGGVDDLIVLSPLSIFEGTNNYSVSVWVNMRNITGIKGVFGNSNGLGTEMVSMEVNGGVPRIVTYSGGYGNVGSGVILDLNKWYHLVITKNGTTGTIYINSDLRNFDTIKEPTSMTSLNIGARENGAYFFNGSMDEVMVWNRALNSTEITAIYNNQSARFMNSGEMLFTDNNFSTNNTITISLANCGTLKSSYLQAKINDGDYQNFSSCNVSSYAMSGNLTAANLTLKFNSDSNQFYSPLIIGNITLTSWDSAPVVTIVSPTNGSTSTSSSVSISVTTDDNSTCNYSTNSGTSNSSLTANSTGTGHTGTKTGLSNEAYTLNVYCFNLQGIANNTQNVSFTVAVPSSTTEETITSSGTGSKTYTASSSSLEEGYSVKLTKNQKVELNLGNGGKVVEVKSITSKKVVLEIGGEEYSFPKNSSAKFDLDNDGTYDLEIKNNDIIGRFADMEFRIISEEVASDEQEEQQSNVSEAIKNIEWWVYVVIGVVIILIVVGIVLKKKKR